MGILLTSNDQNNICLCSLVRKLRRPTKGLSSSKSQVCAFVPKKGNLAQKKEILPQKREFRAQVVEMYGAVKFVPYFKGRSSHLQFATQILLLVHLYMLQCLRLAYWVLRGYVFFFGAGCIFTCCNACVLRTAYCVLRLAYCVLRFFFFGVCCIFVCL